MKENDVGYEVNIGEPVVDAKGVADNGLSFPCEAIPDGDYLVTLEVNGTVIAGRDKAAFASGSATVGDYTLSYSSYAVSVATLTDDDVVVLRIEPLEVKVSDAFRAVVGKAAPAAGSASVGGRFVVTFSYDEDTNTRSADKTLEEISAAWVAEQNIFALFDGGYTPTSQVIVEDGAVTSILFAFVDPEVMLVCGGLAIDEDGVHYYGA